MMARLPVAAAALIAATPLHAQDLYRGGNWSSMASDRRAAEVGDTITVVIYQNAEATNSTQNSARKSATLNGSLRAGSVDESGSASIGSGYSGVGEARRTERFVTQLSVTIREILPNGDYRVEGRQLLRINGEDTDIGVRGRVRAADITRDNSVLSTRIADAEINYDGKGFVSRSARPGLLSRLFGLFGLL